MLLTVAAGLALSLTGCNTSLLTHQAVLTTDNTQTGQESTNFTVPGRWELHYSYDCSKQHSEGLAALNGFGLSVFNADDKSLDGEHPLLVLTGNKHSGVLKFQRGGTFFLDVLTRCDWRVSAVDTSG